MKNLILNIIIALIAGIIIFTLGVYLYFYFFIKLPQEAYREHKKEHAMVEHLKSRTMQKASQKLYKEGFELFHSRGCSGCHALYDTAILMGPSLKGILKRKSDSYLIESLKTPNKVITPGFEKEIMPSYDFTDKELKQLLDFIGFYS